MITSSIVLHYYAGCNQFLPECFSIHSLEAVIVVWAWVYAGTGMALLEL